MLKIENEGISKEEIQGYCEAYQVYLMMKDEEKEKIPKNFLNKMKYYAKYELGNVIDVPSDINPENVSKDGFVKIAYMTLYI